MPTLTIQVKTNSADAANFTATGHKAIINARNLLHGISAGALIGSVDFRVSSADPVAASGTATITYASIAANDTILIGGITLTCKASGANGTTEFNKVTDATATAASLVTAINANTTLSKHVLATSSLGVVTVTSKAKGTIGNLIVMSATGTGIALSQMAGGTGGGEGTALTFGR